MKENREELEARIAAYIDGELSSAESARLEVFLANTDPALAEQVIAMIAEKHAVANLPRERAPEDLAARIMEQVERTSLLSDVEHFAPPRRPWWQSRAAIAAGLFLVLGVFVCFVLEMVSGPKTEWREVVMEGGHKERLAQVTMEKTQATAPAAPTVEAPASEAAALNVDKQPGGSDGAASQPASNGAKGEQLAMAAGGAKESLKGSAAGTVTLFAAQQALAASRPVMLTLVARDAGDYDRLRKMIAGFESEQPPEGKSTAAAHRATETPPPAPAPTMRNLSTQDQSLQIAPAPELPQNAPFNGVQQRQLSQNNSNAEEQYADKAAAPAKPPLAGPYHVALRPDQIDQLTHEFQVAAITRDRKALDEDALVAGQSPTGGAASQPAFGAAPLAPTTMPSAATKLIDCVVTMEPANRTGATTEPTEPGAP